jgi:hypothetical protein
LLLDAGVECLFFRFSTPLEDLLAASKEFSVYLEFQPFVENFPGKERTSP